MTLAHICGTMNLQEARWKVPSAGELTRQSRLRGEAGRGRRGSGRVDGIDGRSCRRCRRSSSSSRKFSTLVVGGSRKYDVYDDDDAISCWWPSSCHQSRMLETVGEPKDVVVVQLLQWCARIATFPNCSLLGYMRCFGDDISIVGAQRRDT